LLLWWKYQHERVKADCDHALPNTSHNSPSYPISIDAKQPTVYLLQTASLNNSSGHTSTNSDNAKPVTVHMQLRHSDAVSPATADAVSVELLHSRNSPTHKTALRKLLLRNGEAKRIVSCQ
jgi:hypothetical protein